MIHISRNLIDEDLAHQPLVLDRLSDFASGGLFSLVDRKIG
jgi:hypothetical protein